MIKSKAAEKQYSLSIINANLTFVIILCIIQTLYDLISFLENIFLPKIKKKMKKNDKMSKK